MEIFTSYLCNLIAKQVDDRGIVIWYDPDRHYIDVANKLNISHTTVTCNKDSFFALRHEIEPLLNDLDPPRLVVYVPLDPTKTHNALVELEASGVIMKPGQQPPNRNTKLSIIARNALKQKLGEATTATIEKQVDAGKLTLNDLNAIAQKGEGITQGVILTIFGTGNPQEVALAFLGSDRFDKEIVSKGATQELALLLQSAFEIELPSDESPNACRTRLARHILATDLISSISGEIPTQLSSIKIPSKPATREACVALAKNWRLRRDLADSYITHANRVEKELGLAGIDFQQQQIANVETFLAVEETLQNQIETTLRSTFAPQITEFVKTRQSSFWSEHLPNIQARWALIAVSGQLLLETNRIEKELKSSACDVQTIFSSYTSAQAPWCLLDTYHRHMERRWHNFDWELHNRHQSLEKLINHARHRYMDVGSQLAETFVRRYQAAKFRIPGVLRQTEVFERQVKPKLAEGKTAYVWVDALRYEMAHELVQTLTEDYNLTLQSSVATVPTITEIGMAALLPSADKVRVVAAGDSKLGLEINGTVLKDRTSRTKFLQENAGVFVFITKLEDLLPQPKKKDREGIEQAELILVTSQEIDAIGEGDNVRLARRTMDDMLLELRRAFRVLTQLGVETIIFAADHGYLFGDELSEDRKIDAPGGDTADLHRRVWVGRGGTADPAYLRAKLSDFELGGDLEIATPWNFSCFKVKGGTEAYFHGGLSPQEPIVPVVTLTPKQKANLGLISEIAWNLEPGSQKISTRFFSVPIKGMATSLFELVPPKVRVEVRVKRECISRPVSASYGFEEATGDVQLKLDRDNPKAIEPDTITLTIAQDQPAKTVASVHLLDAVTGAELARIAKIEMAIAI
ncbi:MAG: hypothetical protein N4J56_003673 [Chroococcidiopsis sp. SAG 2025]|uniref:PglZ domain-containing protein n=1 Tax=Chroococcidiopsis sp. SAG 2025 TaxID=171389 RepID=UPI002937102F|nr:PglZ domain-containing protein [Chroococcidiopsis sp. SAG 2025]MDV2994019.1 hypothetical protein [Chroococcidiopsis sp. SAG 2025]